MLPMWQTPMSQIEYEAAVAQFLAKKAVTRCPTAYATPTRASVDDTDRAELRKYVAAQEAMRFQRLWNFQRRLAVRPA